MILTIRFKRALNVPVQRPHDANPCEHCWPALQRATANKADCNEREERYLIVTCTVIADVPEPFCPLPVAVMAKASLPLYLAFAVYW